MWFTIVKFLSGPVISGLITAYQAKLVAGNNSEKMATDLAATEIAAQTAEMQAANQVKLAEIGHPFEPEKLAFYIVLGFLFKCVIWDTVLGLGSTPPLRGDVATWCSLIIGYFFGKRTILSVSNIIKSIFK